MASDGTLPESRMNRAVIAKDKSTNCVPTPAALTAESEKRAKGLLGSAAAG